jgi:hypothetical protein
MVGRTMANRLNDIINVKDFGAVGNGLHDDTANIQAAIDYAYSLLSAFPSMDNSSGCIVFIPAGTYLVGSPPVHIGRNAGTGGNHQGNLTLMGAGRNATILKGSNSSGFILYRDDDQSFPPQNVFDLTIWNQSSASGSGALGVSSTALQLWLDNLKFIGFYGFYEAHDTYNMMASNCIAECSAPIGAANSASPGPVVGSVGFFSAGQILNCKATGFDTGFAVYGGGQNISNSRASRCSVGIGIASTVPAGTQNAVCTGAAALSNVIDRCKWGIAVHNLTGGLIAGNVIKGTTGPSDPAAIQGMSWNNGNHVVTVTTTAAHNLPVGDTQVVLSVSPGSWTPDGTGTQIVTATRTGTSTFTYLGPSSYPGLFASGTWNYPMEYGITMGFLESVDVFGNVLSSLVSQASFDLGRANQQTFRCVAAAMRGQVPNGWAMHPPGNGFNMGWTFINCGLPGQSTNPNSFMTFNAAKMIIGEGDEANIVDAQSAAFGAVVSGGGSNHYKIRFNGTNFTRVG